MRSYNFRPLTLADLPLMQRWLRQAHVKVWWPDAEGQMEHIQRDLGRADIDMWLVSLIDRPFAYVHDHEVNTFDMPQYADLPSNSRVMATFVGDDKFLGQGHSPGYIQAHARWLRNKCSLVAAGPNTTDTRAIATYRKARFQNRRLASTRDGRLVQVMTYN